MEKLFMPELLAITAQAGAGKDTATSIIHRIGIRSGNKILSFGSGDILRIYSESDTPISKIIKPLLNNGERVPLSIVSELVEKHVFNNIGKYDHIIVHGSPRFVEHCDILYGYFKKEYVQSVKILEVIAPDTLCRQRLFERTKLDLRNDLSIDGNRGIPDPLKIDRKMSWWNNEAQHIRKRAQELGLYIAVHNDRDLTFLQMQLCRLFTEKTVS